MPTPVSEPLFGAAVALVDELTAQAVGLSLDELRIVQHAVGELIKVRRLEVARHMRNRGCTWGQVGAGLGISGQAAHHQYGHLCD